MRLYFNTVNGTETISDAEGVEVDNLAYAHTGAGEAIREMRENLSAGLDRMEFRRR